MDEKVWRNFINKQKLWFYLVITFNGCDGFYVIYSANFIKRYIH